MWGFHPQIQKLEPPFVQVENQHHRKTLLSSFHLNGCTFDVIPDLKVKNFIQHDQRFRRKVILSNKLGGSNHILQGGNLNTSPEAGLS